MKGITHIISRIHPSIMMVDFYIRYHFYNPN